MRNFLLIFMLIPAISLAQSRGGDPSNDVLANNLGNFAMQRIDKVYNNEFSDKVSGEAYLFDGWKTCVVSTTYNDGFTFRIPCNYNLYNDRFEMKVGDEIWFLKKEIVTEIKLGNRVFKPTPHSYDKDLRNYMEVLGTGEPYDLVKQYFLRIKDVQSTTSLGLYEKKITVKDKRYFLDEEDRLTEVPSSKRKIYKILGMSKEEKKAVDGNIKKTENLVKVL